MTSRDFCYWLQGWFELNGTIDHREGATKETLEMIQNHLSLVFKHEIDPSMGNAAHQKELNKIHESIFFNPINEEEAIAKWGPKPSDKHVFNMHGWYNPAEGVPRC